MTVLAWVVEIQDSHGWVPLTIYMTRKEARDHVRERGDGRVRRAIYWR